MYPTTCYTIPWYDSFDSYIETESCKHWHTREWGLDNNISKILMKYWNPSDLKQWEEKKEADSVKAVKCLLLYILDVSSLTKPSSAGGIWFLAWSQQYQTHRTTGPRKNLRKEVVGDPVMLIFRWLLIDCPAFPDVSVDYKGGNMGVKNHSKSGKKEKTPSSFPSCSGGGK